MSTLPLSLAFLLLGSGTATAASLLVRPTTVILSGEQSAASVTVTNSGDAPVTAQVRVFAWDQAVNEDQLTQTAALAASPPMATIPPGQSQTIRLVRVEAVPAAREESYRLLVDEITEQTPANSTGVEIQLRYSVPVFVMPNAADPANLSVTAEVTGGALQIDASNSGKSHAQISSISLTYADGASLDVVPGLVGYVLPDKNRQWRFELPAAAPGQRQPQSVRLVVNGQELLVGI